MKVFIAYDSSVILEKLSELVAAIDGIEIVGSAIHATDAIISITRTKPDLVILDINLNGLNGGGQETDLITRIKKEAPPPIVVMLALMISYNIDSRYRERCGTLGADYLFDKVTEIGKLYDTIKEWAGDAPGAPLRRIRDRHRGESDT